MKSTNLALGNAAQRFERVEPNGLACLLLDLRQKRDDLVDHSDDGLLELAVSLGEHDDSRIQYWVVGSLKGELGGRGQDRRRR